MDQVILARIADLIGDLSPGAQTSPSELERARAIVAAAVLSGQVAPVSGSTSLERPTTDAATIRKLAAIAKRAIATQAMPRRVVRREKPTMISPTPTVAATSASGRAIAATEGPFLDGFGRTIFIDVFDILHFVGIQRTGSAAPFAYVLIPPPSGNSDTLKIGTGSIWFVADALVTGATPSGFVGLRIKGATVDFGSTVSLSATPIVIPAASTVTFALELDSPVPVVGGGPGEDARQADVVCPANVTFSFAPSGAKVTILADSSLVAFGSKVHLKFAGAPVFFDAFLGRVAVPCEHDLATFAVRDSRSTLVKLAGSAGVIAAAWSMPITVATPADLGTAGGAGGIALALATGLTMHWTGHEADVACGPSELLVETASLVLASLVARSPSVVQRVTLWRAGKARGALDLRFPKPFASRFISETIGAEAFGFLAPFAANLDRPRTINDERVRFTTDVGLVELFQTASGTEFVAFGIAPKAAQTSVQSYAIKNLVLKASEPLGLLTFGALQGDIVVSGALVLQFALHFLLPILPDPYAANIAFDPRRLRELTSLGTLNAILRWKLAELPTIDLLLPPAAISATTRLAPSAPDQTLPVLESVSRAASDSASIDARGLAALNDRFTTVAGVASAPLTLLDISTNVSLFGITFDPNVGRKQTSAGPALPPIPAPSIANLFLEAPGIGVHVLTLPAVQWEPVLTPDDSTSTPRPFPSPLTFGDCGGATVLGTDTVTLVPVAPRPAIDALLAAYNTASEPSPIVVRFTLPFGILAVAQLTRSKSFVIPSPSFGEVMPTFSEAGLRGGDQLSLRAARSLLVVGNAESPSLPGAAIQLHNARFNGLPTPTTVLTPIDGTFDSSFGPAAKSPRVPVTRIDISGFGESLFSDWRSPGDDPPSISKVQFDVLVGRASLEVVQAYSILYPYAVRVVRTITIERRNSAAIVRHDSGWQAVSDGLYAFPEAGLVVHPGIVRGVTHVGNIRDTGQFYTTKDVDAIELMAVRFDCDVQAEGTIAGAGPSGVPARDQLGYIQLTRVASHGQLLAAQYAQLLVDVGALGGPIDCIIDIGGSGQRMRVARVDVGAANGMGGPEFAMAAWGSPLFPGGGQWSFLRQSQIGAAPQPVDRDRGVPLIRAGAAPAPPPPSAAYCFADPGDTLAPNSPAADYGIVHATGTQRTFFPRPKIEAGAHAITSTRAPALADPYVLATAVGLFPREDACIPFPDANYSLAIGAGGNFRLQRPSPSFTTPVLKRITHESGTVRTIVYCNDENVPPNLSIVTLVIDTAAPLPWSLEIGNLSLATESGTHGEISRVVGSMSASAAAPTKFANSRYVFGPALKPVQSVVSFLGNFGPMPPLDVNMTNDFSLKAGLKIDLKDLLEVTPGPVQALVKKFVDDFDFSVLEMLSPTNDSAEAEFALAIKVPTPFTPIIAVGIAKFTIKIGNDFGTALEFLLGFGAGVDFSIGIFSATAYFAETQFLIIGDTVFGLGAGSIIKGTVDLEIVSIEISVEAKVALLSVSCNAGADSTIWGVAQVTFALEITIAFVIDIDFEEQAQIQHALDGGPCPLPDVV